jgi:hypothetical protein
MEEKIEIIKELLLNAERNHESAKDEINEAYWQGRKDSYRVVLAEILNDPGILNSIITSVFYKKQEQKNFIIPDFEPVKTEKNIEQCIECGATYFHAPGCKHGFGLSAEQIQERLKKRGRGIKKNSL